MLLCSHGIPYEHRCRTCTEEAIKAVRARPQQPAEQATPQQVQDFWLAAYRQTVVQPKF